MSASVANLSFPAVPSSGPFKCSVCEYQFIRAEHLARHGKVHAGVRPYRCRRCEKTFQRKDTLARHELTHDDTTNLLQQGKRACNSCAQAKVKCCGSKPCLRCKRRNLTCQFPRYTVRNPATIDKNRNSQSEPASDLSNIDRADDESLTMSNSPESQRPRSPQSVADTATVSRSPLSGVDDSQEQMTIAPGSFAGESDCGDRQWRPGMLSSINWLPVELLHGSLRMDTSKPAVASIYMNDRSGRGHQEFEKDGNRPSTSKQSQPLRGPNLNDSINSRTTASHSESSDLYVDATTTRRPNIPLKHFIYRLRPEEATLLTGFDTSWPLGAEHRIETSAIPDYVSDTIVDDLCQHFIRMCVACPPHVIHFNNTQFLSRSEMNILLDKYFSHVHETLPFLHKHTYLQQLKEHGRNSFSLLLAMQVLGSLFLQGPNIQVFQASMFEFLLRALADSACSEVHICNDTRRAQSLLMYTVATNAFQQPEGSSVGLRAMNELRIFVLQLANAVHEDKNTSNGTEITLDSIGREEALRTAWFAWLLGLQSAKIDRGSSIPLSWITNLPLPCHDDVWNTTNDPSWHLESNNNDRVTMLQCLHDLYIIKRLSFRVDDFTSTLLTYAVVHRTWEAEASLRQPLSGIEPSEMASQISLTSKWPPADSVFVKWRNSACDCFDILHWRANAAIGMANGHEPARVAHLHLSRLLILSPIEAILGLAGVRYGHATPSTTSKALRLIQKWALFDQYKARLAAVHAGVTQWHVRRFSVNAYYEPFAVACATITLWALSFFQTASEAPTTSDRSMGLELGQCDTILIDRPTDDELVQQFVRNGSNMRVVMTGVSNLWDADAPTQILEEGKRLISTLGAWSGDSRHFISVLNDLVSFGVPYDR